MLIPSVSYHIPICSGSLTIPLLFVNIADPIGSGLLTSLAKPDGNLTGFANFEPRMGGKWLELLKDIAPSTTKAALVFNPKTRSGQYFQLIEAASRTTGIEAIQLPAEDRAQIERAMKSLGEQKDVGMVVMPDNFTFNHRNLMPNWRAQHRIPVCGKAAYGSVRGARGNSRPYRETGYFVAIAHSRLWH